MKTETNMTDAITLRPGPSLSRRFRDEAGQATAEYALVLLGVAAIAMLLLAWATDTGTIDRLFDAVLDSIIGLVP